MKKSKHKKSEPRLEYLQDPRTLETPEMMKPLYEADEKLRQKLSPDNIGKEIKWFTNETGKMIKKVKRK
jgi:hypothetical protein